MMHECKRILNKQVAGEGLWHADLAKAQSFQESEIAEVQGACIDTEDNSECSAEEVASSAPEHTDSEDEDAWATIRVAADVDDAGGVTEHSDGAHAQGAHAVQQTDFGFDSTGPAPPQKTQRTKRKSSR